MLQLRTMGLINWQKSDKKSVKVFRFVNFLFLIKRHIWSKYRPCWLYYVCNQFPSYNIGHITTKIRYWQINTFHRFSNHAIVNNKHFYVDIILYTRTYTISDTYCLADTNTGIHALHDQLFRPYSVIWQDHFCKMNLLVLVLKAGDVAQSLTGL